MLFNSLDFLVFFPIVVGILFLLPKKVRCVWLLISSYYFYMGWNPKYAVLIALSTIITFASGWLMDKSESKKNKKCVLIGSLVSNLLILAIFKYANFALSNIAVVLNYIGIEFTDKRLDLLLPVGISFYTFQALSYSMDVYRGTIKAEKSFIRYALFVSFFPQLVAGPIERSGNLLTQIQEIHKKILWNYERIRDGILLMFWGYFQKLVIADRAAILTSKIYDNYQNYGFVELSIATVLFAFQVLCDFDGYTNIARGAARVMGFELMKNFRQPYLAMSIKEFWRRWHISLTTWFTDYLYIPLGGSRRGKGRQYANIFLVFSVSGLWHGASWNYIIWGMLHAIYQIAGNIKGHIMKQREQSTLSFSEKLGKIIMTFVLVNIAWVFFYASSFTSAIGIFRQMFTVFQVSGVYDLGLNRGQWFTFWASIAILGIVDILHEKGISIFSVVQKQTIWFRWILYLGLIWSVLLLGIYGVGYDTSQFIYFQF